MNDLLKKIKLEDHGGFVSGTSQLMRERIFLIHTGNRLTLRYDFWDNPGDEADGLTCIYECNMSAMSWPEYYCEVLKVKLGEAVTESEIAAVHTLIRPYIDDYKKIFDDYHSGESDMEFDELCDKYRELKSSAEECVSEMDLDLQNMRGPEEFAASAYCEVGTLEEIVTPDMTDDEIQEAALEIVFVDGHPFHPEEVAEALIDYRERLLDELED